MDKDREKLKKMFIMMRLRVFEFHEKSSLEIKNELRKLSRYEVRNSDFVLVVAFSTHGDEDDLLYGSDGASFSLRQDIVSLFKPKNCKVLEGKPKIFLIQACRGTREEYCIKVPRDHIVSKFRDASVRKEIIASESDILIAYACAPNYKAYRTKREGSWFINDLYSNYMYFHNDQHLLEILTITIQSLLLRADTSDNKEGIAQSSHVQTTLRKFLYLKSEDHRQGNIPIGLPNNEHISHNVSEFIILQKSGTFQLLWQRQSGCEAVSLGHHAY